MRWVTVLVIFLGMTLVAGQNVSQAQMTINREYRIKAAYIFNFGRYTQWPANTWQDKEAPFVIGILGPNPFGETFNEITAAKKLQGRKIKVLYFKDMSQYRPCQILYICASVPPLQQKEAIAKLAKSQSLLVGEQESFLAEGGMVAFFLKANKVRFTVNLDPVKRDDLKISSKVLKLAATVKKNGHTQ